MSSIRGVNVLIELPIHGTQKDDTRVINVVRLYGLMVGMIHTENKIFYGG